MPTPPTITPSTVLVLGADDVYLRSRDPPTAPDGRYDWEATSSFGGMQPEGHSGLTNLLTAVQKSKGSGFTAPNPGVVAAFLDLAINPDAVDDRKGAFAAGLGVLGRLPEDSDIAKKMGDASVKLLYNTIPHPPAQYLGPEHVFRRADGSGNNPLNPSLGQAGTTYARSVPSSWCMSPAALPDPGLVFDTLLKRRKVIEHPGGNSSLIFAFASIVTHSLFRTDPWDWSKNNTSSYLDLSPVYGINQEAQDLVRDKASGRGYLYPDTFSEERLQFLPPAASALLVVFSRNHNYIAENILKLNERKTWSDPPPTDGAALAKQDEEIFQTAKLVNCGHFMSMIVGDYVPSFLGVSEGHTPVWNMKPFGQIKDLTGEVGRGQGNHVSVEFNVLYRWHSTIAAEDDKWAQEQFKTIFDKPANQLTEQDFLSTFIKLAAEVNPDPSKRTFAGLKRGPDGKFSDDDLAKILQDATEKPACSFGFGIPEVLRVVEMMGIEQARQWGVCSMNEFRAFLGLKKFESFEEWNPDPDIANAARRLYLHIDNLELYTGLQCEAVMPVTDGSCFSCGYTTTRAVLGDAIALVRGDRFSTTSFTPAHLTSWGFQDCQRDPNNGGFGGNLPKLLMRLLPRHYIYDSIYGCFPFYVPSKIKPSLEKQGLVGDYNFDRPVPAKIPKVLNTFTGIKYAFSDPSKFHVLYDLSGLGNGYGNVLGFDDPKKHDDDHAWAVRAMFPNKSSMDEYRKWYHDSIQQKIKEKSWSFSGLPGNYVDIVNDVINVVAVHWAADRICGIPLKTAANPHGLFTEQETYDMFSTLFTLTFLSFGDNEHGFALHKNAFQAGGAIQALLYKSVAEVAPPSSKLPFDPLGKAITTVVAGDKPSYPFLSRLAEKGRTWDQMVASAMSIAIGSSVNYAQAAVHVIDFYLDDDRAAERAKIIDLVSKTDQASFDLLRGYVREGMRMNLQFTGLYRQAVVDTKIPQGHGLPDIDIKTGDLVFGSVKNAHLNPDDFPNPTTVDPTRPESSYNLFGAGFHSCIGQQFAQYTIAEIVKVVFGLKNIRRAPGPHGKLTGYTAKINETDTKIYVMPNGSTSLWPGSLTLAYDN
ncbi:heme peroxidase [Dendrothele bispora CBS 962.96]|uniref:Heme peroxidase n=1 Tax=Dendrothele bispora (strain CBS 962.96) TaxID=1314807 RepID=A0A4S8MCG5_DENBC|nr:heme peroxidase [Dendrothele bispora CBS 962.96]